MIYFDNAATGGFKPNSVLTSAETMLKYLSANPGRSGHRLSVTGAKIVYSAREKLSGFLNCSPERVIFTKNCTEALNIAIFGTVKENSHVITTVYEHNSVLRPLYHLKDKGVISLDIVSPNDGNGDILSAIKEKIRDNTCLLVCTSVSNVTGEELPVNKIGKLAKEKGIKFLVDGAQGGGHIPLSVKKDNISMLALAGHKGLCGIMGSGVLAFDDDTDINPLMFGGTGTESLSTVQPKSYPERLESGTLNLPAISALKEGVDFLNGNLELFSKQLLFYTERIIDTLNGYKNITCYSKPNRAGIVAFSSNNMDSLEFSDILNKEYDIAVRGGLHCAPKMHEYLNTVNGGLIRASLAVQNSSHEINYFLKAVKKISGS